MQQYDARDRTSKVTLQLGLLCEGPSRETCDHVHHTVALLNDKTDGFFDTLLTDATIEINETLVGCSLGNAPAGLERLRGALPQMAAVIGPACSDDVAEVSNANARAARRLAANASSASPSLIGDEVFISGDSSVTSLGDETQYPNLARMVSTEAYVAKGVARHQK